LCPVDILELQTSEALRVLIDLREPY